MKIIDISVDGGGGLEEAVTLVHYTKFDKWKDDAEKHGHTVVEAPNVGNRVEHKAVNKKGWTIGRFSQFHHYGTGTLPKQVQEGETSA